MSRCRLSRVIQPTTGWGYTSFHAAATTEHGRLSCDMRGDIDHCVICMETFTTVSMQYCLNAGYLGLYNRQQVGVTPRVIQSTTGWGYTTDNRLGLHLFPYRRRHGALCTCCASERVQTGRVGLYNRQQVGFTPFCWPCRVIQPTTDNNPKSAQI